jgi:hypothetical protein
MQSVDVQHERQRRKLQGSVLGALDMDITAFASMFEGHALLGIDHFFAAAVCFVMIDSTCYAGLSFDDGCRFLFYESD